jgi:O-antigen ligase
MTSYDEGGRLAAWASGVLMFWDRPFGVGPGQFEIISPGYQEKLPFTSIITPSTHSTYIWVLAENGAAVLALFLLGVVGTSIRSCRLARKLPLEHPLKPTAVWITSSLAGILAEGFVIDTLHWRHLWLLNRISTGAPKISERRADCSLGFIWQPESGI